MTERRALVHRFFLYLSPLLVAWWGVSFAGALALVVFALAWRWAISLSGIVSPEHTPELELQTISASHFVEKVRWCMDHVGLAYSETPAGGALGAFLTGRTVPCLKIRTGLVRSSIGNSPEILRYLWGRYCVSHAEQAAFLEPTRERLALEQAIDRCGVNLQVWVYYHILDDRKLTLHAWGCNSPPIPASQRWSLVLLFPLLRRMIRGSFSISDRRYGKAVEGIDALLADAEQRLADGRGSLLGGQVINFTDIAFAAVNGLWMQPAGYGGGKADDVRIDKARAPGRMRADIERWERLYPRAAAFVSTLYLQRNH